MTEQERTEHDRLWEAITAMGGDIKLIRDRLDKRMMWEDVYRTIFWGLVKIGCGGFAIWAAAHLKLDLPDVHVGPPR